MGAVLRRSAHYLWLCFAGGVLAAPYAEQITHDNFSKAVRGSSAIAGVGDWILSNGTLCASISDPAHETYLSHRGGALVDLGHCGRDDDQWHTYHELFNLSRDSILSAAQVEVSSSDKEAIIQVTGEMSGVRHQTRYRLRVDRPEELEIETTMTRVRGDNALYLFGALTLHPLRSLSPFVISTKQAEYSKGFQHPHADTDDSLAMLRVMYPADLHVLVGADHIKPEISYGIISDSVELIKVNGERQPLKIFAINDAEFSLIGNFVNPLWFDTDKKPGLLQFIQTPFMDLGLGETLVSRKRIIVSHKADAASVTDQIYSGELVSGIVEGSDSRILISDKNNKPVTFIKPDDVGKFQARLPGLYSVSELNISLINPDNREWKNVGVLERTNNLESKDNRATVFLPAGKTMQLVFKGMEDNPDPMFHPDLQVFEVGNKIYEADISSNRVSLTGTKADPSSIKIPAGKYRVYASRGPEFSVTQKNISIDAGEKFSLTIEEPVRQVDSTGWISADFHVHSEYSFDSTLSVKNRLADFVSQGGEVLVSTEHKRTVDLSADIVASDLQQKLVAVTGVELSGMAHTDKIPHTIGHNNVFPIKLDAAAFMGGTLSHEDRRLGEVIHAYKEQSPDNVFQLNHPRGSFSLDAEINYLNHLSIGKRYDPDLPFEHEQNKSLIEELPASNYRDIDFDAIELLNGDDLESYEEVKRDWFALLNAGYPVVGTANSDSHSASHVVALPRNYVAMEDDRVQNFEQDEFIASIRAGRLIGTTGPIIDVNINGMKPGDTFKGESGLLDVSINCADWINVEQLSVFINGKLYLQENISGQGNIQIPLRFERDGYLTVEVKGEPGEIYRALYPGLRPVAFSNPVYIDIP